MKLLGSICESPTIPAVVNATLQLKANPRLSQTENWRHLSRKNKGSTAHLHARCIAPLTDFRVKKQHLWGHFAGSGRCNRRTPS
jgi:hypothetical protein